VVRHIELAPLVRTRSDRSLIDLRKPRELVGIRKPCSRCEMVKDLGAFTVDRSRPTGRKSWCRTCDAAACAARYERNPEVVRSRYLRNRDQLNANRTARHRQKDDARHAEWKWSRNERNAQHRARAIEIYGGCCTWCGSTEDLQFDHVNNDGTAHRQVEPVNNWVQRVSVSGKPDPTWLIQLLCEPCHHGPGWKGRRAVGIPALTGASP
jgi:hypothetical protein